MKREQELPPPIFHEDGEINEFIAKMVSRFGRSQYSFPESEADKRMRLIQVERMGLRLIGLCRNAERYRTWHARNSHWMVLREGRRVCAYCADASRPTCNMPPRVYEKDRGYNLCKSQIVDFEPDTSQCRLALPATPTVESEDWQAVEAVRGMRWHNWTSWRG